MIRRIAGEVVETLEDGVVIRTSMGTCFEVQMGGYALPELQALMGAGESVEIHTYHYVEGVVAGGSQIPRLVGFLSGAEREFFLRFIKVPGLSPRSVIRALALPPARVAAAIAEGNIPLLTKLPGIGKKKADQIVTQLQGEIRKMALAAEAILPPAQAHEDRQSSALRGEVMAVLVGQLGYRTPEAENLLERALASLGEDAATESVLQAVFRLRR